MARAWIFQDPKQVKKRGATAASWYVGWIDPAGKRCCKSCGSGSRGRKLAERLCQKTEAELITGIYRADSKKLWKEFRQEYEDKVLSGRAVRTKDSAIISLRNFENAIKPMRVAAIKTATIDEFIAKRRDARGLRKGDMLSPASINHDLRHLKAALRIAEEWGYLQAMPKVRMLKEPRKLITYMHGDHLAAVYEACQVARLPKLANIESATWWRALLISIYMTGWRIGQMLSLRRDDLDLESGTAITRAEDNKGKRDALVKLHPVMVAHLKMLTDFGPLVFDWPHNSRTLWTEFLRIQEAAVDKDQKRLINLPCSKQHKHTRSCHAYGFHDLRRAFATMNADKLSPDALQALMQHQSYQTTQKYINMARQMDQAIAVLHVPDFLKTGTR